MGKASSTRWLGLAGLAVLAALGLVVIVVGSALAYGRFEWTPHSGRGRGGMMGGVGHGGWAHATLSSQERHGMMSYRNGYWSPEHGDGGELGWPGWGCTAEGSRDNGTAPEGLGPGGLDCPGAGDGSVPAPCVPGATPAGGWNCPDWESGTAPSVGGTGAAPSGCGFGGGSMPGNYGGTYCDDRHGYTPQRPPATSSAPVAPEDTSFRKDVQPILDANCIACHGNSSGLSLESYEDVMRGGNKGPVVIAGDPSGSRLIQYVDSGYMPLQRPPLTRTQIQTLANWVETGAPAN